VGERILVVEDETPIAEALGYALRGAGYEVDVVADGNAGLAATRERTFDLMVLDLMLPGLAGLDVCRAVRAESDLPIVMLTARDGEVDRVLVVTLLASAPGRVFTRDELVEHLWEGDFEGDRRAIDVHMSNLRRKLEDDPRNPRRLQTVRGIGYRLNGE
jgi:DNA-binding response OmpR family regulator